MPDCTPGPGLGTVPIVWLPDTWQSMIGLVHVRGKGHIELKLSVNQPETGAKPRYSLKNKNKKELLLEQVSFEVITEKCTHHNDSVWPAVCKIKGPSAGRSQAHWHHHLDYTLSEDRRRGFYGAAVTPQRPAALLRTDVLSFLGPTSAWRETHHGVLPASPQIS